MATLADNVYILYCINTNDEFMMRLPYSNWLGVMVMAGCTVLQLYVMRSLDIHGMFCELM